MKPQLFAVAAAPILLATIVALALAVTVPAAAFAPRWPAPSLTYWQEAAAHLTAIEAQADAAYTDPAALPAAAEELTTIAEAIAELEPPPALLPVHVQLTYTARKCSQSLAYETGKILDPAVVVALRQECARSVKDTHLEAARYAATVGGFPAEK